MTQRPKLYTVYDSTTGEVIGTLPALDDSWARLEAGRRWGPGVGVVQYDQAAPDRRYQSQAFLALNLPELETFEVGG